MEKKKSIPRLREGEEPKIKGKIIKRANKKDYFQQSHDFMRTNFSIQWKPEDSRMMNSNAFKEKTAIF